LSNTQRQVPEKPPTVYIDESYSDRDYYVAALLVASGQSTDLEARFQALRQDARLRWGVPGDVEFHAHDMMQGRGAWSPLLGRVGDAASLYRRLLEAVVGSGARIAVQAVDVVRLKHRFQYPAAPYEVAARRALEQVNLWCEEDQAGPALVVADEIGPDPGRAAQAFRRIIDGTTLAASSAHPGALARVAEPVSLVESSGHTGVQAADLVAYIVRRQAEGVAASPQARRLAQSLRNVLTPAVRYSAKWMP
jgi:hypothetical protein